MICPRCKHNFITESKTSQQNKYLHAVIGELAEEYGYSLNEMKHLLKWKLGYCDYIEDVAIYPSIADMSKEEVNEFLEKIIHWAASEGIVIQSPEEYFSNQKKGEKP